jgi:sugar/nucleoside kinase (ribokinase family)
VVIDVNWRPVFWDDEAAAKEAVLQYCQQADVLKITDEVRWVNGAHVGEGRAVSSAVKRRRHVPCSSYPLYCRSTCSQSLAP